MRIGFTGTRNGMTETQKARVMELLARIEARAPGAPHEFHHGACVGADEEACGIALATLGNVTVIAHPSGLPGMCNPSAIVLSHKVLPVKPPLDRNRDISDASETVISTPGGSEEANPRSGTWSTIRYARRNGPVVYVVFPDGSVEDNEL